MSIMRALPGAYHRNPEMETVSFTGGVFGVGRLSYNENKDTLLLTHKNGVMQEIGQETYGHFINNTGSTIPDGALVGFAGANGEIEVMPYIADGSMPALYCVGIATQEMADGEEGKVTVWGEVNNIDTTGGAESWQEGDILYASPTTAGALTNVRPTSPNKVIVVAAVRTVDAVNGVILVRVTIPMDFDYAGYTSSVDQTLASANTTYAVTYNTTNVENGISLVSGSRLTVSQSGLYSVAVSLQPTSSNSSSSTVYSCLALNGTAIDNTGLKFTIKSNGDTKVLSSSYQVPMVAGDYLEVWWGADTTNTTLNATTAPWSGFAATPSALIEIAQIQY
jgi:hypothetical protein